MRAIANMLSLFRLLSVVPLLSLAWMDKPVAFLLLLVVAALTDAADGWFARRAPPAEGAFTGARLDSFADYGLYVAVPLGGWWLWPDLIEQEAAWLSLVLLSYVLPGALAILRFGRPAGFHTWAAKAAVAVIAPSFVLLFVGGPAWPLRVGAVIALIAGLEQCLMIWLAPKLREEVRSIWHARQIWHQPARDE